MIYGIRRGPALNGVPKYNRNAKSAQTDMPSFQNCLIDKAIHSNNSLNGQQAFETKTKQGIGQAPSEAAEYGSQPSGSFNGLDVLGPSVPENVRDAWMKAEAESGVNGYGMDSEGKLTQITTLFAMSIENMVNGKGQDILGSTVDSAKTAVQKALDRLGIPQNNKEKKEKLFYEAFLRLL